jgi:uncharacterized protein
VSVAYCDSSALVKLIVEERGSENAARLWDAVGSVLTSRVTNPEVRPAPAALGATRASTRRTYR